MKIKFEISDEITVTNTTIKVIAWITGQVGDEDRPAIDARARAITTKMFPDIDWAFSDFSYTNNSMMFRVQAACRIDSSRNDQLEELAKNVSNRQTAIQIHNTDASIPAHEIRDVQSKLRVNLIVLAKKEAEILGGELVSTDFTQTELATRAISKSYISNASYGAVPGAGEPLGHSEKIHMAVVAEVLFDE